MSGQGRLPPFRASIKPQSSAHLCPIRGANLKLGSQVGTAAGPFWLARYSTASTGALQTSGCLSHPHGRNRLAAARLAGVKPVFFEVEDSADPYRESWKHNGARQDLQPDQKAAIYGRLLAASGQWQAKRGRPRKSRNVAGLFMAAQLRHPGGENSLRTNREWEEADHARPIRLPGHCLGNCRRSMGVRHEFPIFCHVLPFLLSVLLTAPPVLADSVDGYIREQMNAHNIPGVVLLVLRDGEVIKQQSYGLANIELSVPISKDSVFPLASVTKVFTATAVYLLVQEGKLHLGDKVTQLLPGLPKGWTKITVLNCLSHTSGIEDIFPGSPVAAPPGWLVADSPEAALKKLGALPLLSEAGVKSAYNQTEFLLLKMVIEKSSGMSLEEFLSRRIFAPLGMTSARFGDSLDIVPNRVGLYMNFAPQADRFHVERLPNGNGLPSPDGKLWNDINFLYPEYQHGGVGLNMSAGDLAIFDRALSHDRVLNRQTLELMWTPFRLNDGRNSEFTGGWETVVLNNHRMVFHIGAGMVEYAHLLKPELTVILFTNNQGFDPYRMTLDVMQFFVPEIRN
jgi:CubicO group peptidase (beta-lactamase class C family)